MGREGGGGFWKGNRCTPVADSCRCMAKPIQYCKVISLQLNKFIFKKKEINELKLKKKERYDETSNSTLLLKFHFPESF